MSNFWEKIKGKLEVYGFGGGYRTYYKKYKPSYGYWKLKIVWLKLFIFEGASAEDFFIYHLYERTRKNRKEFVLYRKSVSIIKTLNRNCKREFVENKNIFAKKYKDFLCRESVGISGLTWVEFLEFYHRNGRIICKPYDGCNGNGIFIVEKNESLDELEKKYNFMRRQSYIIEGVLVQEGILHDLNPKTLNTFRVNVLNNQRQTKVANAILRSGQGDSVTDNICAGGCVCEIDIDTGEVITKFVDLSNHTYDSHPITHITMLGRRIPHWEAIKKTAIDATKLLEGGGYVSWDIALIEGGKVAIVEGNTYGNFNIQQVPRQYGVWKIYKEFLLQYGKINK